MTSRAPGVQEMLEVLQLNDMSRRQLLKRAAVLGLAVPAVSTLLAACGDEDDSAGEADDTADEAVTESDDEEAADQPDDEAAEESEEAEEPADGAEVSDSDRYGGELRIAIAGEPPSLDWHQSTALMTVLIMGHVYELLFTWDEEFAVTPDLVDTFETSDDGLLNTIRLREGVMFHNGEELTADDVYASIDRWANVLGVGFGQDLMNHIDEMRVVDDYTLEFDMTEAFGTFPVVLARQSQACAIYPKSIVDEAGADTIPEFIGTGPYRFVEWQSDQHILVERFEDYLARDEDPSGYAGRKHAYVDSIRFVPMPDEAARVAGLQAGDFDHVEAITSEQFEVIQDDENVVAELGPPIRQDATLINMDQGVLADLTMRRAVQAAVDFEQVLTAAHGADYIRLDPGLMWQETIWHSTAGEDKYNLGDPDLAAEYLEEAGYDGEVIRLITTQEFMDLYNTGAVIAQNLEDAGMTVDLQVYDWATLLDRQADPTAWELCTTWFGFRVDPVQLLYLNCEFAGRWCSDEKNELVERLRSEVDLNERVAIWEQIQALVYEEVVMLKTGESMNLLAYHPRVRDLNLVQMVAAYWNTWIDE